MITGLIIGFIVGLVVGIPLGSIRIYEGTSEADCDDQAGDAAAGDSRIRIYEVGK